MIKRLGLMILVLAVSITSTGFGDTADDAAPTAGPPMRPLDVVASCVTRGLASLRSPPTGLSTCDDRRPEILRAAGDLFDVGDIARRALGRHWKALAPDERGEFVRLFRRVLAQSFVKIVERYSDDDAVSAEEEVAGTLAHVRSRITPGDAPESTIEYRLSRSGARWTVYDIDLDGVSLVSNYRSQFNAIIVTSSVAELFEWMRMEPARCRPSPDVVAGVRSRGPR
jgi:phospholipid transport system substrate-binding protein